MQPCLRKNLNYWHEKGRQASGVIHLVQKVFRQTHISHPLIRTRTSKCLGVRNVSFSENFAYVLNGWLLTIQFLTVISSGSSGGTVVFFTSELYLYYTLRLRKCWKSFKWLFLIDNNSTLVNILIKIWVVFVVLKWYIVTNNSHCIGWIPNSVNVNDNYLRRYWKSEVFYRFVRTGNILLTMKVFHHFSINLEYKI